MKLGRLFDGSGTAPLAAAMVGFKPVWASEIEPYPIKVTKARFPNMKHLGSILDSGTLQAKENVGKSLNYINPLIYESNGFGKYREGFGTLRASCGDCGTGSENLCVYPDVTGPLMANSHPGSYTGQDAFNGMLPVIDHQAVIYPGVGITSLQNASNPQPGDPAPTLSTDSRNYLVKNSNPPRRYIVRRLTPLECCRLQGFPDWWEEGVEGSDSARYKMWGNGMALPNMLHVMRRLAIAEELRGGV